MAQNIDFVDLYDFLLKSEVTEPITIEKHGKPYAVMIPHDLYQALRGTRKALHASELSQEDIQAIMDAEIPEELKQYNHEVEE